MYLERWGTVNLVKNHLLDSKITTAAFVEFLEKGFSQASLHQISEKAGVTTGALYTRYKKSDRTFSMLSALQIPIDYKTVDLMIHASFYFYQKLIENWDGTIYSMQVLDNIEIALYAAWNSLLRK